MGGEQSANGQMKKGTGKYGEKSAEKTIISVIQLRMEEQNMNLKQTGCLGPKWLPMPQDNDH